MVKRINMTESFKLNQAFTSNSTFSHIGRWATAFDHLIRSLDRKPKKVLELGSGCIEPIHFSKLLPPDSTLVAVDRSSEIINYLERMISGEKILLATLANIVCNKENYHTPRLNTDLTDPELIELGLDQLKSAGLNSSDFYNKGLYGVAQNSAKIVPVNSDIEKYCADHQNEFDITTLNCVLVHLIRELIDTDKIVKAIKNITGTLKGNGVLFLGSSITELYGSAQTPKLVEDSGGIITDIILDNIVKVEIDNKDQILGGVLIRVVRSDQHFSPIDITEMETKINAEPFFKNLPIQNHKIDQNKIGQYLSNNSHNLVLAAIRKNNHYIIWETPTASVENIIPSKREQLNLLTN